LRKFEAADLYGILGVAPEVQDSEIKSAYHEFARQYHPDCFQSEEFSDAVRSKAQQVFTYITGAYRTLGDAARRAAYDSDRARKDSRVETALKTRSSIDLDREKMAEALCRSGRMALAKQDFERAAEQLRECVWLRPDVGRYRLYLGAAQAEIPHMHKEAEQHLLKAIEFDCMQTDAYMLLGKLYMKVGLPRRAEQQFREALRWDPKNAEAERLLHELGALRRGRPSRS
jgi:curved DNA-binding protein CbpA